MNNLKLKPGSPVIYEEKLFFVRSILDQYSVVLVGETGDNHALADVSKLQKAEEQEGQPRELTSISDKDWQIAQQRFAIIQPLLNLYSRTKADIEAAALASNTSIPTIYRWIRAYEESRTISALAPTPKNGGRGKSRINPDVEVIISEAIDTVYLQKKRASISRTIKEVKFLCRKKGLAAPHPNTIRNRIADLCERDVTIKRYNYKAYKSQFGSIIGHHPDTQWPLGVIQIDHTPANVILVDDNDRMPIGRPYITLAIDLFSRTISGYYISLDEPSAISFAMCLYNAVSPKDHVLSEFGIEAEWPNQGLPATIQMDNAKEFRSKVVEQAVKNYSIEIDWRPIGAPEMGGHIERLLGTFSDRINDLDGTTKSNVADRGEYDSERESTMTLREFEKWFVCQITYYHYDRHSELGMPPMTKLKLGLLGTDEHPGQGVPPLPMDMDRFWLDLLPFEERTIQPYGVQLDHIHYFHDVLRPWVNAKDPDKRSKRKFLFRRDFRDISAIFFWDPDLERYFRIPYRDIRRPKMSIWDYRAAKRRINETHGQIDEDTIFKAYSQIREIESSAKKKTKNARRMEQKRKEWGNRTPSSSATEKALVTSSPGESYWEDGDIQPFDDIEIFENE